MLTTLALLATHQDEQQRIYEFIRSVVGDRQLVGLSSPPDAILQHLICGI